MNLKFDAFSAPKSGSGATLLKFAAIDPNTGLTSSSLEVRFVGTGFTYNNSTGALTGQINQIVYHDGTSALHTITLDTSIAATSAADVTAWLAQVTTIESDLATLPSAPTFTSIGGLQDFGTLSDATSIYDGAALARVALLNGSTVVGWYEFLGSSLQQYMSTDSASISAVRLLSADGSTVVSTKDYSADPLSFSYFSYALGLSHDDLAIYLMRGNDTLVGTENDLTDSIFGDDVIDAGIGNDTITGATGGSDTVSIDTANEAMKVVLNEGSTDGYIRTIAAVSGGAVLKDIENIYGSRFGGDDLTGNSGANVMFGGVDGARDTLRGGLGNDTYILGADTETTVVSGVTVQGTVDNVVDTGGTDTILSSITRSLGGYTDIEVLTLTGANNINGTGNAKANTINGNTGNNVIRGDGVSDVAAADTMVGGNGNDTYYVNHASDVVTEATGASTGTDIVYAKVSYTLTAGAYVETLSAENTAGTSTISLTGNEQVQLIIGDKGVNTLNGGADSLADTLRGGAGNDIYVLDNRTTDIIDESATQSVGGYYDTIKSTISRDLADFTGIEFITLTGSGDADAIGNAVANKLVGNDGKNLLKGLAGSDTLTGGAGIDTFYWDNNGTDKVTDYVDGTDKIDVSGLGITEFETIAQLLATTTTGAKIERKVNNTAWSIELLGINKSVIGASDFVFSTSTTGVSVSGFSGVDHLFGSDGNDTISGGASGDKLFGQAGADKLDGGTGADTMFGGTGNDTYVFDATSDTLVDTGGTDTIQTAVSIDLSKYTALIHVENLQTTNAAGTTGLLLTGNDDVNVITGNDGANKIDGKGGADTLSGNGGNDSYYIDNSGDAITAELSTDGAADRVYTTVNYAIGAGDYIEYLQTAVPTGTTTLTLTGNSIDQTIIGNNGVNHIDGLGGNDTLTGSGGSDNFLFTTTLNASTNVDKITDFNSLLDTIKLDNAVMSGLGSTLGTLASGKFYVGTAAHDLDDRIIYNKLTGTLTYDSNGSGAGGATVFAILTTKPTLTNADFVVI